jgi:hypothetical protein
MLVWRSRKWILGRMFPGTKPLIVGGALLLLAGIALGARQRASDE